MNLPYSPETTLQIYGTATAMEMRAHNGITAVAQQVASVVLDTFQHYGGTSENLDTAVGTSVANCRLRALFVAEAVSVATPAAANQFIGITHDRHGMNILLDPVTALPVVLQNSDGKNGNPLVEVVTGDNMIVYHPATEHMSDHPDSVIAEVRDRHPSGLSVKRVVVGLQELTEQSDIAIAAVYLPGDMGLVGIRRAVALGAKPESKKELTQAFSSGPAMAQFIAQLG